MEIETFAAERTVFATSILLERCSIRDAGCVSLTDFMAACNFSRRPKALDSLTPYEYIAGIWIWISEPNRFIVTPIHQTLGLNT